MRARTIMAEATALAMLALVVGTGPGASPAGAQEGGEGYPEPVSGNFAGGDADELFVYRPGPHGADKLLTFEKDASGTVSTTAHPFPVNAYYRPVAGDFDGDGYDELLWYGRGNSPDYLWNFTSTTAVTSQPITVGGAYEPVAGDFAGDGADDVFWYGQGSDPDHLWDYDVGGSRTSVPFTVGGAYLPLSGSFGDDATDDIFWYADDARAGDYLWDFHPGSTGYASASMPVNGYYLPFALDIWNDGPGGGDIFWYAGGAPADYLWDFIGGNKTSFADPVSGHYFPTVAGDYFGDGADDVLWFTDLVYGGGDSINVWDHELDGGALVRTRYTLDADILDPTGGAAATTTAAPQGQATIER